jgi:hypothetical protein
MYEFMNEMQTLAFRELEPDAYASITKRLAQLSDGGGDLVRGSARARACTSAARGWRPRSPAAETSLIRSGARWPSAIGFEQLSDIMAFRVIVRAARIAIALGLIHHAGRWCR